MNGLGRRLFDLRQSKNLTVGQLSNQLNISRTMMDSWENGQDIPSLKNAIKLSEFYGVTIDYIAKGDEHWLEDIMGKKIDSELLIKTLELIPLHEGSIGTEDFNKRVISVDKLKELIYSLSIEQ